MIAVGKKLCLYIFRNLKGETGDESFYFSNTVLAFGHIWQSTAGKSVQYGEYVTDFTGCTGAGGND